MGLLLVVEIIPTIGVFWLSLTDYNPIVPGTWQDFVGLDNFRRFVDDPQARQALYQTLLLVAIYLPTSVIVGLGLALLLDRSFRGRTIFRGIFFLPVIASWVVGSTVILWFLDPRSGGLAIAMQKLGLGAAPALLQEPSTALITIAMTAVWKFAGYNCVIFLAGLQSLNHDLFDAAKVDGAGAWKRLWYVTMPGLRPVMAAVIILNLIMALRLFDPILVMTNGGPNFSTTTLSVYFYQMAWGSLQFGYGSAITVVLTLLVVIGAGAQFAYLRAREGRS